jgi:ParB-like chromosome segregation protein Spo0J
MSVKGKSTETVELWPVADVKPYEQNAKLHDAKQVAKIAASIKKFGWRGNPIVVDEDGVILAGHGRRLAAIELGRTHVPVEVVKGMSDDEKKAYRLADNRVAVSVMDSELLQKELASLANYDLDDIFDKKELAFFESDLGELNADAFVDDLDVEIERQAEETTATVSAAAEKEVPIAKALGFKSVKGRDERVIAVFMARAEEATGKQGAEAFVEHLKSLAQ